MEIGDGKFCLQIFVVIFYHIFQPILHNENDFSNTPIKLHHLIFTPKIDREMIQVLIYY